MSDITAVTYDDCQPVTPQAATIWNTEAAAGFFSNVAGVIQIITARGTNVTMTILAGLIYPIAIKGVVAAGTNIANGNIFALTAGSAPYRGLK